MRGAECRRGRLLYSGHADMTPPDAVETSGWHDRLEEILHRTAPPAGAHEIADQGLRGIASTLGAPRGVLIVRPAAEGQPVGVARYGDGPLDDLVAAAEAVMAGGGADPGVLVEAIPGAAGPLGALAIDLAGRPGDGARRFARSALRVVSASLYAARAIEAARVQGEQLARRNVELETLRELAARIQESSTEEEILQTALDTLLTRLGLEAGWIFWGEERHGRLELAAARGVSEEFVRRARVNGVGICLCLDVFDSGRLRLARNTTECPRLPELVGGSAPMTHACIPLKFDRGVLGVLNIAHRPGEAFTRGQLEFLETAGTQVCLAVDKARTGRAEVRRNAEARALASLADAIGGSLDQERVLTAVGDDIRTLVGFDRCAIFLRDPGDGLRLAWLGGPSLQGVEVGAPVDLRALGSRTIPEALDRRQTVVIDDAAADPRSSPEVARRWGIGSAIAVPLAAHGEIVGVLHASRQKVAPFTPDEVALVGALAAQAAVAIENARLYRETREALLGLQRAQEATVRAERLAAVGTLAASLAHEVRNPLNSISLMLVLLKRRLARLAEAHDPDLVANVDDVRREVDRLDGLVEEFLSLSTLDRLERTRHDPSGVAREALVLVGPLAAARGVAVREELTALPPVPVDRQKLKQVLLNLVRNAIEAMPTGGTLTVAARPQDGGVVIEVTDTGVGIDPGIDVFDFFTSTKRGGTGLGLPISRRIVEAHGGTLAYESTRGRGTTFRVALPGPEPIPGEAPAAARRGGGDA